MQGGSELDELVFWMKQTVRDILSQIRIVADHDNYIHNACGAMTLMHAAANVRLSISREVCCVYSISKPADRYHLHSPLCSSDVLFLP